MLYHYVGEPPVASQHFWNSHEYVLEMPMTAPPLNPYEPTLTSSQLSVTDASAIQHRDLAMFSC
jgi:hypothetical protein